MPLVGFEPTFPLFERTKTVHALDSTVTVTGKYLTKGVNKQMEKYIRKFISI
jgi:hypothetical protein